MTAPFTLKKIGGVPGALNQGALSDQLTILSQQELEKQKTAPPPDSAVDFARQIERDYLSVPQPGLSAPPARINGMLPTAVVQQEQQVQQRGGAMADAVLNTPLASPLGLTVGASGIISDLGTLSPEEQDVAQEEAIADAQAKKSAIDAHAEVRAKMRAMPDAQAEALGLPVAPGGTDPVALGQGLINDFNIQREVKRDVALAEAEKPKQTWWLNAAQVAAKSAAQMGTAGARAVPIAWEAVRDFVNLDLLTGGGRSTTRAWVDSVDVALDKMLPGDKAQSRDFLTGLSAGAGSFAGFMTMAYIGGAVGLPPGVSVGALGAASEGSTMFTEAERSGATSLQKYLAFIMGAGLGLTEAAPIDRMFMRANAGTGGLLQRMLAVSHAAGEGALTEFIQEFGQAVGEDMIAKYGAGFDPDRELDAREWAKAGVIGAITGASGGAGVQVATRDGAATTAPPEEQQRVVQEAIDAIQRQVDSMEELAGVRDNEAPEGGANTGTEIAETISAPEALIAPSAPSRLYHGTDEEFDQFDTSRAGTRDPGFFGTGTYFTADPEVAEGYGSRVVEAEVQLQNPFIWDVSTPEAAEQTRQALASFGVKRGEMGPRDDGNLANNDERRRFNAAVRRAGHDGVVVRTQFRDPAEVVVFDPGTAARIVAPEAEAKTGEPTTGRGGTIPTNDAGKLELTHWSREARATLDPATMATGPMRGQERARLQGPDAVPRTYYGVNARLAQPPEDLKAMKGELAKASKIKDANARHDAEQDIYRRYQKEAGYIREGGLGNIRHTVTVDPDTIYNWNEDPLDLNAQVDRTLAGPEQVTQKERLIRDAGFSGYFMSNSKLGQTVALFDAATPDRIVDERTGAEVDAPNDQFEAKREAKRPLTLEEKQRQLVDQVPGFKGVSKYLQPDERTNLTKRSAARLVEIFESLPDAKEMAAVAISGRAKRGWYENSANALVDIFGIEDAPRFTALLAALSPQTSVETNTVNALKTWTAWDAAGRPQDRKTIMKIMGRSVEGGGTEASILDSWKNNSMRALTAPDPTAIVLSGPKVDSFMRNLWGVTSEVTNDAWMANFANVEQTLFKGAAGEEDALGVRAAKSIGYKAMSAATRAAADAASKITGETWTPAEIQETVWSWAKTLYETASTNQSAIDILNAGGLTNEAIGATPDFATLFTTGVYRNILEKGGYNVENIRSGGSAAGADGEVGPVSFPEGAKTSQEAFERHLRRAARRLDDLRARRDREAIEREQEATGRVAPVDEDGVPQPTGEVVSGGIPFFGDLIVDEDDIPFFGDERVHEPVYDEFFDQFEAMRIDNADLTPLPGLPKESTGPIESVVRAARAYAEANGILVRRQAEYVKADPDRGKRIADAYAAMKHDPTDPAVAAAYRAMIDETLAQYQFVKASGLHVEAIEPGQPDPYPGGPREVLTDLQNGHLWFFPTDQGFGSLTEISDNPLLEPTNEFIGDRQLVANDVFRIVHDFFGHGLEGVGFGARGEENAWQAHMRLFTEAALPAVTSETRGQNSWVNFGPYGEANRANQRETVYADQKTGIMPSWTWTEGVADDAEFEAARKKKVPTSEPMGTAANRALYEGEQARPAAGIPETPANVNTGPSDANLAKISKNFIAALNLTVRQGRMALKGSDVMGQYDKAQRALRLRTWNDLSTLVHEGGHALNDMMAGPLQAFVTAHDAELQKVAKDLYGGDVNTMPARQVLREGFAEFFRVYTLNRAYAVREYPTITDEFQKLLEKENPAVEKMLLAVGAQFAAFLQAPSTQLMRDMVVSQKQQTGINGVISELREAGVKNWFSDYTRSALAASINRYAGLNKLVSEMLNLGQTNTSAAVDLKRAEDPRALARLAPNFGQRAQVQLIDGIMPYQSVTPATPGLRDAILISQGVDPKTTPRRLNQQRLQDFDAYLVSMRAIDEYRRWGEGKIERPPVGATLGDLQQAVDDFVKKYGDSFTRAGEMVHEIGMAMWKKQFDAGLMDKATYTDGLERQFYAPLQRDMSDKQNELGPGVLTGARSLVKRFKGSDRQIISPTEVLMHKLFSLEKAIAENDVKKALAQLADRVGTAGALVERIPANQLVGQNLSVKDIARALTKDDTLTAADAQDLLTILSGSIKQDNSISIFRSKQVTEAGENILFYFDQGKVAAIQLKDGSLGTDIVNLVNGLGRENLSVAMELIAGTSQVYRTAITAWPDFLIVNFIRDQMSAWVLNNVGFVPFATGFGGMVDEVRQRQWARMYNASMGIMGGMNVAALHKARMERDIDSLRSKGYLHQAFGDPGFMGAIAGMGRVMELSETGTRLGLYKKAFQKAKADGLTDWEAALEAGYLATDYIDFGLNGNRMLMWRRTVPFLNAQLQGFYKMVRVLGADEVRQRKGLKFVLGAYFKSTKGMELSRLEKQAINTGRAAWAKMVVLGMLSALLHFIFEDDEDYQEVGEYMRVTNWVIPLGDGRIISIPKPFELAMIANAVERGLEAASGDETAKGKFIRGAALSLTPPMGPPAVMSAIELAANYDFFTGQEIVPTYQAALTPELQYNNYTSSLAKELGPAISVSPLVLDHILSGLGASAYRDMTTVTNALDPNRPSFDATDAPIARRFVRDMRRGSQTSADFWGQASTLNGKLRSAEVSYKAYIEQGNQPAANRFLDSLSADEKAYALLTTHFKADAKRLNPFYRGRQIATIVSAMRREMTSDLGLEDTDKFSDTGEIKLTAKTKAAVDETLSEIARREMRNTLIATGAPGWSGKKPMPVEPTIALLEEQAPRAAEEYRRRIEKAKVYDGQAVFEGWPEVRDRLIQDREDAYLDDMVAIAKVSQ